jgi:HEAT repeat protein
MESPMRPDSPPKDQRKTSAATIKTGGTGLDPKAVEAVRDILNQLGNTVSAMKIYPSDHITVKIFVDEMARKFGAFLDAHGKLEVGVAEYSFLYGGKPVYTDEMTIKSLPFFFFKDGAQILYFYQGLERDEILEFLELIKSEALKPAGESDIVTALWERDFSNIQYYAPDDYLENRIIEERTESQTRAGVPVMPEFAHEIIEIKVDTSKFTTGRVELTPQDKDKAHEVAATPGLDEEEKPAVSPVDEPPAAESGETRKSPAAAMDPTLTEEELQRLESLVRANRKISPDEEFLNLMVEILNLEKDAGEFSANLDVLLDYHHEQLGQGNFSFSIPLVHRVHELGRHLLASAPEKSALLDEFLKKIISPETVESIKFLLDKGKIVDWDALLEFFTLLGPSALPLAVELYESVPDPEIQNKILGFIKTLHFQDLGGLASLAVDERPRLSVAIIRLLADDFGERGLPHFSAFLGLRNKTVKLEAVRALGEIKDEMANRILMGFLKDEDEDVRVQAAMKLRPVEESSRIRHLIAEADAKAFREKSLKEKQAILSFLGRTRTEEALAFLRKILEKRKLWLGARDKEMKLAAGAGLESMGTDEAAAALERGAKSGNKEVREACAQALARRAREKVGPVRR